MTNMIMNNYDAQNFPYYNMGNNNIMTPEPQYYDTTNMQYVKMANDRPHIDKFMRDFNDQTRPKFNKELFRRDNNDIIEGIKKVILSCKRDKYFILDVLDFEVITDYDKVQNTLRNYYSRKTKDKGQNQYDFIEIKDSDIMLLKVTYYIKLNVPKDKIMINSRTKLPEQTEGKVQSLIILPIYVDKYYFRIGGNYYCPMYQIVDGSTYNNATSNNSKIQSVTLKTQFMPIKLYKEYHDVEALGEGPLKCALYTTYIFKKKTEAIKFILGRYGIYGATEHLGIDQIYITKIPEGVTKKQLAQNLIFPTTTHYNIITNTSKIMISVPKHIYDNDKITQSFCYTLLKNAKKFVDFQDIFDPRYWNISLGSDFSSPSLDKGIPVLDSFESIYDIRTKESINLPYEDKKDSYCILRWMMREFAFLRKKDNLDISTKRIRMADEYLPYIYAAKLSTGIYRISDKGKNVTFNDIVRVINTDPAYIIKNINTSNLAPYVDLVNDNDAELALSYTYKGISGIGEQGGKSAVPIIYRYVDPSHIGRLDLDASSSSDPGLSGVLCPMVETINGQFAQYQETNGWEDHYSRIRQEANTNNGVIEGITFDKKPELAYEYVKDDMVKETIAEHTTFIDGILDINGIIDYGLGAVIDNDSIKSVIYDDNIDEEEIDEE